jgi:uncharacterized protein (DUF58 family)
MWAPTPALGRAVLVTGLLAIVGVLLGRADLVLLAAPLALGTAWALRRRPSDPPAVGVGIDDPAGVVEGGEAGATVSAANPGPVGLDLVVVRTEVSPWLSFPDADRPQAVTVPPRQVADLVLAGPARRWGRHRVGPATAVGFACDGLLFADAEPCPSAGVAVYPATKPFEADQAMPRAAGLAGAHRSRRPGEGGELAGVRRYAPGDRLRRVDWRVSLRTRQLHVAATLSDRDAELVLVLDVLAEAGESGGVDGSASVLDTTVRAAAAISEHYLQRGDRVSLVEYGRWARRLRPASGRRQYLTVLEWLLDIRAGAGTEAPYERVFGPHQLSPNALIVVLTPLIDPGTAPMLARLARSGRHVVAVGTLPAELVPGGGGAPQRGAGGVLQEDKADLAYRLWRLERGNTIGALREHGVPVVGWAGAGKGAVGRGEAVLGANPSLDQVLRDISRLAPKAVPR